MFWICSCIESKVSIQLRVGYADVAQARGVAVAFGVAVGVGVADGHDSLPIVMNVPGELWLLYSVATQLALRSIVDSRTSSSVPAALSEFAARDMK